MSDNPIKLPFQSSHAFIIGINDYQHVSKLSTAINDAKRLKEKLEEEFHGYSHGYTVHSLLLNATKSDLVDLLENRLHEVVGEEDRVLLYFAGHGIAVENDDQSDGYLVPADARPGDYSSLISMKFLRQTLDKLACRHGLLVMDCCYSGAFKWSSGYRDVVFDLPDIIYEERLARYASDPAWQVITSSSSDQKAMDFLPDFPVTDEIFIDEYDVPHSPFALAFFDALDGKADVVPRGQGDGVITGTELYTYLRDRVEEYTMEKAQRQTPSYFALEKHDKGEYIFLYPHLLNLPSKPERNPFKGLEPYTEQDDNLFKGRNGEIRELQKKIDSGGLVLLSGGAGVGKTSLIRAGIHPYLRRIGWNVLGKKPSEEGVSLDGELDMVMNFYRPGDKNLLIIDDFGRKVSAFSEEERSGIEEKILFLVNEYDNLTILLVTRKEYEPVIARGKLWGGISEGYMNLSGPDPQKIREILVKSTLQEVMFFEPDSLLDRITDEIKPAKTPLPLLSAMMAQLYDDYVASPRKDRSLNEEDYNKHGGMLGYLTEQVEKFYLGLKDIHDQNILRKVFLRMIFARENDLAVQKLNAKSLDFDDKDENDRIDRLIKQMVDARVLFLDVDAEGQVFYEMAHPDLLTSWQRLHVWTDREKRNLEINHKLNIQVSEYEKTIVASPKARQYIGKLLNGSLFSWREILDFLKIKPIKIFQLLWDQEPALDGLMMPIREKNDEFNKYERSFLKTSFAYRERKKKMARVFQFGISAVLLIAFLISQFYYREAKEQKEEAIRQQERAESNENRARNRLKEILYKDFKEIIERAETYENIGKLNYAIYEYDAALQFLNDPDNSEDTFIDKGRPESESEIDKSDLKSEVEGKLTLLRSKKK